MESIDGERRPQAQFVAEILHDLRSPIAGLRARLEEALLDPDETPPREVLGHVLRDVDRMEAIINDLLASARGTTDGTGARENVNLAQLVMAEISRRGDRVAYELRLDHGVIVNVDRIQIVRLLSNLLDNAQRHADGWVEIEVHRNGNGVELTVADDGAGIAEADRERVFERFTRLPAGRRLDGRGTGLGLTISRDIARAHSGTLGVDDSATGGARFVLRLPHA